MTLTIWHVIGILATLAVIVGVSIYSGRSVKSAADFDRGGSSGPWLVAGAIMGALVSGQATVGTAQLAYSYGLAAWWFTLGAGIGCLLLAVGYVVPLRHSGSTTLLGIVSQRYGKAAGYWGSVLCSLGIFISVIAQVISATALLTTIFPMGMGAAALVSVAIMTLYVVFGGVTGAGMGGVVKLFLLYLACIVGSLTVWSLSGGVTPLLGRVSDLCQAPGMDAVLGLSGGADAFHTRFLSLVARGPLKDVGSGI
ncbi:sodium:solute symporter family transporter, partial [Intestinimonas butyriciproducens]|uniref:sodium:solute symporter family transporter n=2 Tax=Eubacteriales incertae sedis TaxID=538999 RepID=UPI003F644F76